MPDGILSLLAVYNAVCLPLLLFFCRSHIGTDAGGYSVTSVLSTRSRFCCRPFSGNEIPFLLIATHTMRHIHRTFEHKISERTSMSVRSGRQTIQAPLDRKRQLTFFLDHETDSHRLKLGFAFIPQRTVLRSPTYLLFSTVSSERTFPHEGTFENGPFEGSRSQMSWLADRVEDAF